MVACREECILEMRRIKKVLMDSFILINLLQSIVYLLKISIHIYCFLNMHVSELEEFKEKKLIESSSSSSSSSSFSSSSS